MRPVTIWSEGTRLAGDLYVPEGLQDGEQRPAIVLCHGFAGTKAGRRGHAERFAAAGYIVLSFDYRGWGESDSKVVDREPLPKVRCETTARVQVIRDLVDPFDQLWDIIHALDYLEGEPAVDPARIGLWGTSFGGGLALWLAAHDERVRCVVSQVAFHDARELDHPELRARMHRAAIRQARGESEPIPQAPIPPGRLAGTSHGAKFYHWAPVEEVERVRIPILFIDAEHDELLDRTRHSAVAYRRMLAAGRAPTQYHVVPGISHYGIYDEGADESIALALGWFGRYLRSEQHRDSEPRPAS